MKKLLLIAAIATTTAFAQKSSLSNQTGAAQNDGSQVTNSNVQARQTPDQARKNPPTLTQSACGTTAVQLGSSANINGVAFSPRTNVWYDKNINSIQFVHRADPAVNTNWNSGYIVYDLSTDGGATWSNNQGPIYDSTVASVERARYPVGGILNIPSNTNPTNAAVHSWGPQIEGANWIGPYSATQQIGSSTHDTKRYYCNQGWGSPISNVPFQVIKNTSATKAAYFAWDSLNTCWSATTADYGDSVIFLNGTPNLSPPSVDYARAPSLYAPMILKANGKKNLTDLETAWSDDGQVGYAAFLGNDGSVQAQQGTNRYDSTIYLIVYKTTDGGNSWNKMTTPCLNNIIDSSLNLIPAHYDSIATSGFEIDAAVDINNNVHIALEVGGNRANQAISSGPQFWGVFDIYSDAQGNFWVQKMANPLTFRGTFTFPAGNFSADSRPQVSRNYDGSKIFVTWFDTDTTTFGVTTNTFPDMHVRGYDVNTNMWTPEMNMTAGTDADGNANFGMVSYYTIPGSGNETVPLVYTTFTGTTDAVSYFYFGGACVPNNAYTDNTAPTPLTCIPEAIKTNAPDKTFAVSANYPNPFTGATNLDITLAKATDVTVQITSMLGQTMSTQKFTNLTAGKNTITVDGSSLANGMYIYKVVAGENIATGTMTVK